MKKYLICILLSLCVFSFSAKEKQKIPYSMDEFKVNKTNRRLGYQLINNCEKIVFVFDADAYKIKDPRKVCIEGSFNGWDKGKNANWMLDKVKSTIWTLECPTEDVLVPGNSGFPEFKFYVNAEVAYIETVCGKELHRTKREIFEPAAISRIPGFSVATNNLILLPSDDPTITAEIAKKADISKKLKDFDLTKTEYRMMIANFRLVPGTSKLFRGYHPYKMSRAGSGLEKTCIKTVNELILENQIKSIITLCGNESITKKEKIDSYIQSINYAGNHFFTNTFYNTVYYNSSGDSFGEFIYSIVDFINTHDGPYYVHCRLGTDRTGVVSAVLASLCGATWDEIVADYQKSNEMGIKEYRDYRLLQYSFENILGCKINEVDNLKKAMSDFFIRRNFLNQNDIDKLVEKLK